MTARPLEILRERFAADLIESSDYLGDASVTVRRESLIDVLRFCRDDSRLRCVLLLDVAGVDWPGRKERFDVVYLLRGLDPGCRLRVKVRVAEGGSVPTACGLWKSAEWHEREAYDLFGMKFDGHPDLRRLLTHHQFEGHALRKDYPIEKGQMCYVPELLLTDEELSGGAARVGYGPDTVGLSDADEEIQSDFLPVNIGPSHPATHGALRVEALLDGETIVHSRTEIGYLHRCFEKEAEDHTWQQIIPYTDRLNYVSSLTNNVGYALAVEKMLGVTVPERAQVIRVIVGEMGRIMDHLVCIGANLVDIGALTNFWYFFNAREWMYKVVERLCGERLTTSYTRVGGLYRDLYEGFEDDLTLALTKVEEGLADVTGLVQRNRIFMDRCVGVGVMSAADALSWGWTGPCLRASGVDFDLRKVAPYSGYETYDFDIPVGENGDAYDRILVRIEEMYQSMRIIRQGLERMPDGPIQSTDRRVAMPPKDEVYNSIEGMMNHFKLVFDGIQVPAGEAYGFTEGANGELGFYMVSDGGGHPYRMKVRPPCFPIFASFNSMMKGQMVADAVATLGGLNIIAGELDR
ncbi:NADH-quinone oxidoreductase subunit C [bacterium]|nr:MAG: NADH-quinone oxidoreductase subunit C [bacterium]